MHICFGRGLRGYDDPYGLYRPSKDMLVRTTSANKKKVNGLSRRMYVSFLKRFRLKSLILGINHEVGNTKTKGLNLYVIRKVLTQALNFVGNEVSNPQTNTLNS